MKVSSAGKIVFSLILLIKTVFANGFIFFRYTDDSLIMIVVLLLQELNSESVIPKGFPEWAETMNSWGSKMIAVVEVGLSTQKNYMDCFPIDCNNEVESEGLAGSDFFVLYRKIYKFYMLG